jgi:hypothetical protein
MLVLSMPRLVGFVKPRIIQSDGPKEEKVQREPLTAEVEDAI